MSGQNVFWSSTLENVDVSVRNKGLAHLLRKEIPNACLYQQTVRYVEVLWGYEEAFSKPLLISYTSTACMHVEEEKRGEEIESPETDHDGYRPTLVAAWIFIISLVI